MLIYLLYLIFSPIIWLLVQLLSIFNYKIREHLTAETKTWKSVQSIIDKKQNGRKIVWFHAASAGEFEQLKPILKQMDRDRYFLLQTFFSPTIFSKEKSSDFFDAVCYHPFDFPWSAIHFLKRFKPHYYIITRHDIWPNHLYFAKILGIKTYLINANLHDKSARLKFGLKQFNKWLFSKFDLILTGSERLKQNLTKLVIPSSIIVTGDTRFDQVIERKNATAHEFLPTSIFETKNIIFGSIIQSDYDVVFGALGNFYPDGDKSLQDKKHRVIIVPHEIDEDTLTHIETLLGKVNMSSERYTNINGRIKTNAIIVDTVGILADLYKYANLAYVGAGFGAGVHSVIEPAVYGCAISFGPNIHILDEAIEMYEQNIGTIVYNQAEFIDFLKLIDEKENLEVIQEKTRKFVYSSQNASKKIIETIFGEIN